MVANGRAVRYIAYSRCTVPDGRTRSSLPQAAPPRPDRQVNPPVATVVSERKRTETLVCDGCRNPLHEGLIPEQMVTLQVGTERVVALFQFHRLSCSRRWLERFEAR